MPMRTADLQSLEEHLNGRSYIDKEEMTEGDAKVYALFLGNKPNSESYPNVSKWYEAVKKKLALSYLEKAGGAGIGGQEAKGSTAEDGGDIDLCSEETEEEKKAAEQRNHPRKRKRDSTSGDDVGEEMEEEQKAAEEREAVKASAKKKGRGKTSVARLEISIEWPWDGETSKRYKKRFLENASNLDIEGLVWSAFKIVEDGEAGGVMEVHILLTVLDDLVDRNELSSNVYSMLVSLE